MTRQLFFISRNAAINLILFLFALSFTFFAIQSGDVLMYLALARDFLLKGQWPNHDPYLYSLANAELHIAHEYLSYLLFYTAWFLGGFAGLIFFKMCTYALLFTAILRAEDRGHNSSALWMALWILAIEAASFRFIERSSMLSDLFYVLLVIRLLRSPAITRRLILFLCALFLLWVQLHPGFPLGLLLLGLWGAWNFTVNPQFRTRRLLWLFFPLIVLFLNPLGAEGVFYPFHFAAQDVEVLRRHNFEWFPSYHPAFLLAPETIAFWVLCVAALGLVWRERAWLSLRGIFVLVAIACALPAVRFIPWASFVMLVAIKPWAHFRAQSLAQRYLLPFLALVMVLVTVKNLTSGYLSSSGRRIPQLSLDSNFFPQKTVEVLQSQPIAGRLYNAHDFGSYLIWQGYTPIFHHGFVTDMDFYEQDVVGVFKSQERFLELAKKYGWTMLLVDKHGSYPYFFKILSPLPDWKIVAEDDAAYLIYWQPDGPKN